MWPHTLELVQQSNKGSKFTEIDFSDSSSRVSSYMHSLHPVSKVARDATGFKVAGFLLKWQLMCCTSLDAFIDLILNFIL